MYFTYNDDIIVHVPLNPVLTLNIWRIKVTILFSARLSHIGRHAVSFHADREPPHGSSATVFRQR